MVVGSSYENEKTSVEIYGYLVEIPLVGSIYWLVAEPENFQLGHNENKALQIVSANNKYTVRNMK